MSPRVLVHYGTVLDLTIEQGHERVRVDEWNGWHMLVPENAMDVSPGRARIYLVRGKLAERVPLEDAHDRAQGTYERWHQRGADFVGSLDVPDAIEWHHGRVLRIGYRSDKWHRRGKVHDYDHDFTEDGHRPPLIYCNTQHLARARAALIRGGDMAITEGGID